MATTHKPYSLFIARQFDGNAIDWDAATVKAMLVTSAYTLNIDTHEFISSVIANEVTGAGYTARGFAVPSRAVVLDTTSRWVELDAGAITSAAVTVAAFRYIVFYSDTGTNGTSRLISIVQFDTDQSVDGALTITPDESGVGRIALPA